jgi:RNA polymerase sigma factor (sigma-70 family)
MTAGQALETAEASVSAAPRADVTWIGHAYEAHAGELEAYVAHRFGGHVTPEDVVHEAFARLVHETSAGRAPHLVRPWLYRVAHNLVVSEMRRPIRFTSVDGASPAWEAPSSSSAEMEPDASTLSPELRQALAALSRAARISILMAADGYSGREIATAVGRSELAARALLCRARRTLREILAGSDLVADLGYERPLAA